MPEHKRFVADHELKWIADGLLERSLPRPHWAHAGHFAATIWILARRPDLSAAADMPDIIRTYNEAVGGENSDTAGYHETITQASIRAAQDVLCKRQGVALAEVCNGLLAGKLGDPEWLLAYWSRDALFSVAARRAWLSPDLCPLPF